MPIKHVSVGRYILRGGESVTDIAEAVYGDRNKYVVLLQHNKDVDWDAAGDIILVPNKRGRLASVRQGESTHDLISRMFPGQLPHIYFGKFAAWNADQQAPQLAGKEVFCPER